MSGHGRGLPGAVSARRCAEDCALRSGGAGSGPSRPPVVQSDLPDRQWAATGHFATGFGA